MISNENKVKIITEYSAIVSSRGTIIKAYSYRSLISYASVKRSLHMLLESLPNPVISVMGTGFYNNGV